MLVGAGIAMGGGAAAWAGTTGADGPRHAKAKACLATAKSDVPDATRTELRSAVKECLTNAGIEGRTLTTEQRAKREEVRSCLEKAKATGGDKAVMRSAAAACLEEAGLTRGRLRAKVTGARECVKEVRGLHPGADRGTLRPLVEECVRTK